MNYADLVRKTTINGDPFRFQWLKTRREGGEFTLPADLDLNPVEEKVLSFMGECFSRTLHEDFMEDMWFDYHMTVQDSLKAIQMVSGLSNRITNKPNMVIITKGKDEYVLTFEDPNKQIRICKDGVYEVRRGLRIGNELVSLAPHPDKNDEPVAGNAIALLNGHGVFVRYLITLVLSQQKLLAQPSTLFDKLIQAIPYSNLDEVAVADGDRDHLEKYKFSLGDYTFWLDTMGSEMDLKTMCGRNGGSSRPWCFVSAALRDYNLVQTPGGTFIDGRRAVIRMKDVPAEYVGEYLNQVLLNTYKVDELGKALNIVRAENPEINALNDSQLFDYLKKEMIYSLSTKTAKVVKRVAADASLCAEIVDV